VPQRKVVPVTRTQPGTRLLLAALLCSGLATVCEAADVEPTPPAVADPVAQDPPEAASPSSEELQPGRTPSLSIKFFSDVRAILTRDRETKQNQTQFSLNEVDTLITSELSDKVQVLSEVIYHFKSDDNETALDIERLQIRYSLSKYFALVAGRVYVPVSYWNYIHHHVIWFQTSANRPDMHRFEDEGGLLPTHAVGLNVLGRLETKPLDLDYTFVVSNGRGKDPGATQIILDDNKSKAIALYAMASPNAVPGLSLGGSLYLDKLPNERFGADIPERILSGYFKYNHSRVDVLAEYNGIRHEEPGSGRIFNTTGFYAQLGYRLGRWEPYYRYDRQDVPDDDPYFGALEDVTRNSVGVRVDVLNWNALMAEYSHRNSGAGRGAHEFTLRTAFTF
jgi:hypothetical protein